MRFNLQKPQLIELVHRYYKMCIFKEIQDNLKRLDRRKEIPGSNVKESNKISRKKLKSY